MRADTQTLWNAYLVSSVPGESGPLIWLRFLLSQTFPTTENQRTLLDSGFPRPAASESPENLFKSQIIGPPSNLLRIQSSEREAKPSVLARLPGGS